MSLLHPRIIERNSQRSMECVIHYVKTGYCRKPVTQFCPPALRWPRRSRPGSIAVVAADKAGACYGRQRLRAMRIQVDFSSAGQLARSIPQRPLPTVEHLDMYRRFASPRNLRNFLQRTPHNSNCDNNRAASTRCELRRIRLIFGSRRKYGLKHLATGIRRLRRP